MVVPQVVIAPANSSVAVGGKPVVALYGPLSSGIVTNPFRAEDQGIAVSEVLYVSLVGDAAAKETGTTFAIQPGGTFSVPANFSGIVSVNAATSGHKFSAFAIQPTSPYTPPSGSFPPSGPTTLTKTIPSYPYKQYDDDDDVVGFVDAFNELAQNEYVDWFALIGLPIYTGDAISADLLDWVAAGLYGFETRPALPSGRNRNLGPLNTYAFNVLALDARKVVGNQNYFATTDDVFKRIITWHFYKGDGKVFDVRWLKRRIMRFLLGTNGTAPNVGNTDQVSVTFGVGNQVNITLLGGVRNVLGGALFNGFGFNTTRFDQIRTEFVVLAPLADAATFKAAVEAGVLELPFQFDYVVNIR